MSTRDRLRLAMVIGAVVGLLWLLWLARAALVPFFIGAVLAYLLNPLVNALVRIIPYRHRFEDWARITAILIIYGVGVGVLSVVGVLLVPRVVDELNNLFQQRDEFARQARQQIEEWLVIYEERVPQSIQEQIERSLEQASQQTGDLLRASIQRTLGLVTQTFSVLLGFLTIPIWLFYVLKDQPRTSAWFYGLFPPSAQKDVHTCMSNASRLLANYFRAQVTLGIFIGVAAGLGLSLLNVPFAVSLAVVAGITELIPIIGPIIGAVIALTVTLAVDPGIKVLWVLLLYVGLQQFENNILVPRIQGAAVKLHPAVIIILLVTAGQIFGLWGMILIVPVAAVVRETFIYIYRRLSEGEPAAAPLQPVADAITVEEAEAPAEPTLSPGQTDELELREPAEQRRRDREREAI